MNDIRLLVFDLDGTLIDSSADLANAVNTLLTGLGAGRLPDPEIVSMVGEGAAILVQRALTASGLDPETPGALDRFLEHYNAHLLDCTRPYDGMVETLETLSARIPLAVLTNKPAGPSGRILEGLDLGRYFRAVIGGDSTFGRKPSPGALMHLADMEHAPPESVLLVGDSGIDLATARNAGTRVCLARYGFGFRFTPADFGGDEWFIDQPRDLIGLIAGIGSRIPDSGSRP
jgi:phosphoglycolate phosphatase